MKFQTRFFLCYILPRLLNVIVASLEKEAKETRTQYDDLAIDIAKQLLPYLPRLLGCENADRNS